jgi:hypothetical protein
VRDLEKLTKKAVPRKRVEGFDYSESAPVHFAPQARPQMRPAAGRPQYRERRRA